MQELIYSLEFKFLRCSVMPEWLSKSVYVGIASPLGRITWPSMIEMFRFMCLWVLEADKEAKVSVHLPQMGHSLKKYLGRERERGRKDGGFSGLLSAELLSSQIWIRGRKNHGGLMIRLNCGGGAFSSLLQVVFLILPFLGCIIKRKSCCLQQRSNSWLIWLPDSLTTAGRLQLWQKYFPQLPTGCQRSYLQI